MKRQKQRNELQIMEIRLNQTTLIVTVLYFFTSLPLVILEA